MNSQPVILLIGRDDALIYLIERYARRGGLGVHVSSSPTQAEVAALRPAAVWFSSLHELESLRPRQTGLIGDDDALLVCSSSATETARANELGADYCTVHPLTYADFVIALDTVGVSGRGQLEAT